MAIGGKSWGKQRTQYAVLAVPRVAVATSASLSFALTATVWLGAGGDVVGWASALSAPGEAVIVTVRRFDPAAQGT